MTRSGPVACAIAASLAAVLALAPAAGLACSALAGAYSRHDGPVLRDPIPTEAYEAASDPHVFVDMDGRLRMIYSGDDAGRIAIRLASGTALDAWQPERTLLGASVGLALPGSKETPFYRLSPTGEHQIYFIGYNDEEIYDSEVYLAVAPALEGPYTVLPGPVMPRGTLAGRPVHLITSPSIVDHEGLLYMVFLAWDGFHDVTMVWVMGAVSEDEGRTWRDVAEVPVPIGMEGQVTPMPGGGFAATRTGGETGAETVELACADHPFGPYEAVWPPALTQAGPPWEVDEIIAPQAVFVPGSDRPVIYYTGAEHARGWWIMLARPEGG